jgi:hypothetical protein
MEDLDAAGEILSESRITALLADFFRLGFTISKISVISRLEVSCSATTLGDLSHWRMASAKLPMISAQDVLIVHAEIHAVEPSDFRFNELRFKVVMTSGGLLGWLWEDECAPA